jgi:hypothetical protein
VREERDAATARDDVIQAYCRHEATWATLVAAVQMLVLLPSVASSSHAPNSGASRQAWRCGPVRPRPETHTRRCGQDRGRGCVKMGLAWGGLLDQVVREVMLRCVKHGMWLTSSCEGGRVQENIHRGTCIRQLPVVYRPHNDSSGVRGDA